ncbi:hypothetical protein Pyn_26302 [Prunus yedoensis var. nudiflora]|uniref:Uncharacterized protein n=1 Tax=Prunus yedoensis var. nudiflora TaxID=2094558 RepID=A0A315B2W5_PRUYE|nr:hypothetical protein Pyn_07297 [Prunus yedoensis var. nudiflora]PQQ20706.1 hypothetical protein Pyn_26302 [Prunus yedoensis var. nudiflora]
MGLCSMARTNTEKSLRGSSSAIPVGRYILQGRTRISIFVLMIVDIVVADKDHGCCSMICYA